LFSGIGGIELGFEREGFKTKFFVEYDPYCQAVLNKRFPDIEIHADIKEIEWNWLPKVDILTGGFPCQDISDAGKRKGITGSRSGLWKEYLKAIRILRPKYVVIENVSALRKRGLNVVLADLAEIGYDAEWETICASWVGAPTKRERILIVAYPLRSISTRIFSESTEDKRRIFAEVSKELMETWHDKLSEPALLGVGTRIPCRLDRIRCVGNSVVPQVAQYVARLIKNAEKIGEKIAVDRITD
jgi:DNA (cytosine-5)-methyltransferase 1